MASPNFRFEKRQRELAKQKKKEEKRLKKEARKGPGEEGDELPEGEAGSPGTTDTPGS